MVTHMKTTIEIAQPILEDAKDLAKREGVTLRLLVEEGLRSVLSSRQSRKRFQLKDAGFKGKGLQAGVEAGSWSAVRDAIYEGRGA